MSLIRLAVFSGPGFGIKTLGLAKDRPRAVESFRLHLLHLNALGMLCDFWSCDFGVSCQPVYAGDQIPKACRSEVDLSTCAKPSRSVEVCLLCMRLWRQSLSEMACLGGRDSYR